MLQLKFIWNMYEPTLYMKSRESMVVVFLYMGDLLVTGRDIYEIEKFKKNMSITCRKNLTWIDAMPWHANEPM